MTQKTIMRLIIIKHSPYYSASEFSKLLNKKGGLSILSVNIQCVNAKFDEFQAFIDRINVIKPINVICLQECWLKNHDNVTMFNLTGYDMVYQSGRCCAHGGLIQWRSEGGQLPPGAARRGAPKSCQRIFKK